MRRLLLPVFCAAALVAACDDNATTPAGDNPRFVMDDVNGRLVGIGDVAGTARALAEVLGRAWDPEAISGALPVGNWSDVADQVLGFMATMRRRNSARDMH